MFATSRPESTAIMDRATVDRYAGLEMVALVVHDASMVHPSDGRQSMHKGDQALVVLGSLPKPGQIAMIYDRESRQQMLRKATFVSRGTIKFVPHNGDFPSVKLNADSDDILGVVVRLQRSLD